MALDGIPSDDFVRSRLSTRSWRYFALSARGKASDIRVCAS